MDRLDWAALLVAIMIVSFQIFAPPVIGLSDNGDFGKIIARFDMYHPDQSYGFADTTFLIDPQHHWRSEVISSEILFAGLAFGLNRIFSVHTSPHTFDIRWVGALHAAVYLLAFYLALPLLHGLSVFRRAILMAAIIVILGDVMYVSALNSFYMDTAAWVLLSLAVVLYLRALRWKTVSGRLALLACMALLTTAKSQHVVAGCLLLLLMILTARRLGLTGAWLKGTIATGVVAIGVAYAGIPSDYAGLACFNLIFFDILPHSDNLHRDLLELGLDDSYAPWLGLHAFSTGGPMDDPGFARRFREHTGLGRIALYDARHPAQPWRLLIVATGEGGHQRPYLGNYDRRTGVSPLQESNSFSLWSSLKRDLFWHKGKLYLAYLIVLFTVLSMLAWTERRVQTPGVLTATLAFSVLAMVELLISSLGDALDPVRHAFFLNGLSDLAVVMILAFLLTGLRKNRWQAETPAPQNAQMLM